MSGDVILEERRWRHGVESVSHVNQTQIARIRASRSARNTNLKKDGRTMSLNSLQDLMVHNLKDLYNAERQILGALPRMAKAAQTPALKEALENHRKQTETHLARLEEVFGLLDLPARGNSCKAMEGLIAEGKEVLEEDGKDVVKDAGIISAAQKVEHYEISAYGTAATYADLLGQEEVARLLAATLNEEREADRKLSAIAEEDINTRAIAVGVAGEGDEMEDDEPSGRHRR